MANLQLQSEDALYFYLKKFLKTQPRAVQLDGSTKPKTNRSVTVVFEFSVDHRKYKLFGDLTRAAAERFVRLTEEHGSAAMALKEWTNGNETTLILADTSSPEGWHCASYREKSSDKLKKAG